MLFLLSLALFVRSDQATVEAFGKQPFKLEPVSRGCLSGYKRPRSGEVCKQAAVKAGKTFIRVETNPLEPKGCVYRGSEEGFVFNLHNTPSYTPDPQKPLQIVCVPASDSDMPNTAQFVTRGWKKMDPAVGCPEGYEQPHGAQKCKELAQKAQVAFPGQFSRANSNDPSGCVFRDNEQDMYYNPHMGSTVPDPHRPMSLVCVPRSGSSAEETAVALPAVEMQSSWFVPATAVWFLAGFASSCFVTRLLSQRRKPTTLDVAFLSDQEQ